MKEIEIITKGKTYLELLYEIAQRYCAAEQMQNVSLCDFYRSAGSVIVQRIVEKQIEKSNYSYIEYLCSFFSVVTLCVSVGMTFAEVKDLLAIFGIK